MAEVLLDGLYNWRDKDSVPEDDPTFRETDKRQGYEELGVIDGYHRPDQGGQRPRTKSGKRLTSVGEKVRDVKEDDIEMILDTNSTSDDVKKAIVFTNEDEDEDDFELEV
jgi:hypothetical protein